MSSKALIGITVIFKIFCFEKAKLLVFKDSLLYVLGIFIFFTSKHAGAMSQYLQMLISDYRTLIFYRAGLIFIRHGNEEHDTFWIQIKNNFLKSSFDYNHLFGLPLHL